MLRGGRMNASRNGCLFLFFLLSLLLPIKRSFSATDTITTALSLHDGGDETIVSSPNGTFELGFFSPDKTKNRYVGIWYKNISVRTYVWVANREAPLYNTTGILKVIKPGILVLVNGSNGVVWSTNSSRSVNDPIAQLLDSGNLVVRDADDGNPLNPENSVWQSFEYLTDTYLPGMNLGWDFVTGHETYLSSWKNHEDPAPGEFTYRVDRNGYPQNVLERRSVLQYRAGMWNGLRFTGSPNSRHSPFYRIGFVFNQKQAYFTNQLLGPVLTRAVLNQNGVLERWIWIDRTQDWILYLESPTDNCDTYKLCGAYGSCDIQTSPVCGCLDKFEPRHPEDWLRADWSGGCVRRTALNCTEGDKFLKYSGIKLPDTQKSWFNQTMTLEECKALCTKDCSCMAYSNIDIRNGGSGCLAWSDDLLDIRVIPMGGQDIYIKVAASEIGMILNSIANYVWQMLNNLRNRKHIPENIMSSH